MSDIGSTTRKHRPLELPAGPALNSMIADGSYSADAMIKGPDGSIWFAHEEAQKKQKLAPPSCDWMDNE